MNKTGNMGRTGGVNFQDKSQTSSPYKTAGSPMRKAQTGTESQYNDSASVMTGQTGKSPVK